MGPNLRKLPYLLPLLAACTTLGAPPLEGTAWRLDQLAGKPALAGSAATLAFAEGNVQGSDGCNRYAGPYRFSGGRLEVGPNLAATQMACPEPVMDQARDFLAALVATRSVLRDADRLQLVDGEGAVVATLVPADR